MAAILFFTILGFSLGLVYVIRRRHISPSGILAVMFKGLISDRVREYFKGQAR